MKTELNVYYCTGKYLEGFKFLDYVIKGNPEYIHLGAIEVDNPFDVPDGSIINGAKIEAFNEEIKEHKAQINMLENKIKDLLCVESKD